MREKNYEKKNRFIDGWNNGCHATETRSVIPRNNQMPFLNGVFDVVEIEVFVVNGRESAAIGSSAIAVDDHVEIVASSAF